MDKKPDCLRDLDKVRHIEGFPLGTDEDICALSDSPYYTAYPNPHLADFIAQHGALFSQSSDKYDVNEPYVENEKYGRTDRVYNSHPYHTKVPPQAIEKYIAHYLPQGGIVLDPFSGTGMTGVASQRVGANAILVDLSPIATFISSSNCSQIPKVKLQEAASKILREAEREFDWLYETKHSDGKTGRIVYTIWSDLVECPICKTQQQFWDLFINTPQHIRKQKRNQTYLKCVCNAEVESGSLGFVLTDDSKRKQVPVQISYVVGKKRFTKKPDQDDLLLVQRYEILTNPYWFPENKYMDKGAGWGDLWRQYHIGIETTADFFMKRNLLAFSSIYARIMSLNDRPLRNKLLAIFTATLPRVNRLNRYMPEHNRHVGPLSGTLYVSKLPVEINVFHNFSEKIKDFVRADFGNKKSVRISTQSATGLAQLPDQSIDYVFTDPPFGDNLPYAELNFIAESWLNVTTNTLPEAIVSNSQGKSLSEYRAMMMAAFHEIHRVLKPGRWLTVEFHNSRASVWNAIQDSLARVGFIIAQVVILDKKKGTTKQLSYAGAVDKDLIINAYKPRQEFAQQFLTRAGAGMERAFIKQHLGYLPIAANVERTREMLYSKMLAYYIQRGYEISLNSAQFYRLLAEEFVERDGYWFRDEAQAQEYEQRKLDPARKKTAGQGQGVLFISDERSAIAWLHHFLAAGPQTYSDLYTAYAKALQTSDDQIPELKQLLEETCVQVNGHWKRPDALTAEELETRRRDRLLRQFNEYLREATAGQKLSDVRKEAILTGFEEAYRAKRYQDIIMVGGKLNQSLVDSSTEIFDFIDIAGAKLT